MPTVTEKNHMGASRRFSIEWRYPLQKESRFGYLTNHLGSISRSTHRRNHGIIPLVQDLPVLITHTVDKKRKIFKYTTGYIEGWTLATVDGDKLRNS